MLTDTLASTSQSQRVQSQTRSRRVRTKDTDWHIEETGSGPVCLMLHGTGASSHSWSSLVPGLASRYSVVCVDLPGHARTVSSHNADLSLPGISASLNALLEQEEMRPEVIVGHSAGAAIMLELCLTHGCEPHRLVSINGAVLPLSGLPGWVFSPLAKLSASASWLPRLFAHRAKDPRQVHRLIKSTGSVIDADSIAAYQRLFQDPKHVAGVLRMMSQWRLESLLPRLPAVRPSVQLIAATGDRTIPLRDAYRLKALLSKATLDIVDGKGHLVHEEAPEPVATLILDAN